MNAGSEQARVADAEEAGTCGGCGQPLTRRGPSGECLRCLMGFALSPDPDVEPGGDARRATTSGALRYGHFEVAIGADGRPIAGPKNAPTLHPPLYPSWQEYFRKHQPPMLIVWGKNDFIFPPEGAHPYKRDLKNVELHLSDTGHFALEENGPEIAEHMRAFLARNVKPDQRLTKASKP